ncbi:MAG: efflux RND transporter periplasmic adaptor subunit [Planctomycetales bacterium]|nr:efflux RND transporter periplasmic adaptor subunit [Planctomycetales bacterium]
MPTIFGTFDMSTTASSPARVRLLQHSISHYVAPVVVIGLALFGGFVGPHLLLHEGEHEEHAAAEESDQSEPTEVTLPPAKVQTAGIQVTPVERSVLQPSTTVTGKIGYNETAHLELRAPVDCVVKYVFAQPGQTVQEGDQLALLSSAQIGTARNEILQAESTLQLAQREQQWTSETATNLTELVQFLATNPSSKAAQTKFKDKKLGEYRARLLASYSQLEFAEKMVSRSQELNLSGVISGRSQDERLANKEALDAQFLAEAEQCEFDARQQQTKSDAAVELAERQLTVARENLATLLGPFAESTDDGALSDFVLRAPISGRIEDQRMVQSLRFLQGEIFTILANTETLWVSAQIHQKQWASLDLTTGSPVTITSPTQPDDSFLAKLRFIGAEVSDATQAVPLVAEFDSAEMNVRPGMFVWVTIPQGAAQECISVPISAIQRHEDIPFVFVQVDENHFHRRNVELGVATLDQVEVTHGLSEGDQVVTSGAFYLKSELLLEREEE